jgi:hypothetical protein
MMVAALRQLHQPHRHAHPSHLDAPPWVVRAARMRSSPSAVRRTARLPAVPIASSARTVARRADVLSSAMPRRTSAPATVFLLLRRGVWSVDGEDSSRAGHRAENPRQSVS